MKFRELKIGDRFDFVSPNRMLNSYFERCVKRSAQTYTAENSDSQVVMRVGSVNVEVYHVEQQGEKP
jgi:hypothetical protein